MASKFIVLAAFAAVANAGLIGAPLGSPLLAPRLASPIGYGSPLLAQQIASPYASPLLAPRLASPIGSPLLAQQIASPYASPLLAPRLASPLVGSPLLAPRVAVASPIAKTIVPAGIDTDYDPNPSYSYAYDVQDALTGDNKNQQESRQGDVVQGSYSLTEPDGTRRTVDYTADPINGFNAVVRREPLAVVQKAVVAAPALSYASPIAKTVVAAPAYARIGAPLYG